MPLITPPYHVALVVEDVERAKTEIGAALGLTWARTQRRHSCLESADGRTEIEVCFTYSLQGPPYVELVEQRPGTVLEQLGLHHIGLWSDDPAGESERLAGHGWARESVTLTPDGKWAGGLFHRGPAGLRVEIVDIGRSGPKLACYLAGGDYAAQP